MFIGEVKYFETRLYWFVDFVGVDKVEEECLLKAGRSNGHGDEEDILDWLLAKRNCSSLMRIHSWMSEFVDWSGGVI